MEKEEIIDKQIELLEEISKKAREKWGMVHPDTILALYKEINNDLRMYKKQDQEIQHEEKPTSKQLEYIKNLGGDPDRPKTRKQASEYIEELKIQKQML